jgi:hypothetical protein
MRTAASLTLILAFFYNNRLYPRVILCKIWLKIGSSSMKLKDCRVFLLSSGSFIESSFIPTNNAFLNTLAKARLGPKKTSWSASNSASYSFSIFTPSIRAFLYIVSTLNLKWSNIFLMLSYFKALSKYLLNRASLVPKHESKTIIYRLRKP